MRLWDAGVDLGATLVKAVAVPVDAARPPTLEELRDHVKGTLPAYCAPRRLELVDALPRNETLRKVLKFKLLEEYAAKPWPT